MLADEPLDEVAVETPLAQARAHRLRRPPVLVPVVRAGLGMVDAFLRLLPDATVGHIGLWRDEKTRRARRYLVRLPPFAPGDCAILLDPMLATGGSALAALRLVERAGAKRLRLCSVIAAPEGVRRLAESGVAVDLTVAHIDPGLDERAFIVPGLGDAGDRQFGVLGSPVAPSGAAGADDGR
jgi:uracil phosphoribosyltransferase